MNYRALVFCFVTLAAPAVLAQSWVKPSNCPAQFRTLGTGIQRCPADSCTIKVTVVPPTGNTPCIASITNGDFRVTPSAGPNKKIKWQISSCPASKCRFDDTQGIYILTDPATQMIDPSFTTISPRVYGWKDKNDVNLAQVTYEPRVWWQSSPGADPQACCPIDPKITNDN